MGIKDHGHSSHGHGNHVITGPYIAYDSKYGTVGVLLTSAHKAAVGVDPDHRRVSKNNVTISNIGYVLSGWLFDGYFRHRMGEPDKYEYKGWGPDFTSGTSALQMLRDGSYMGKPATGTAKDIGWHLLVEIGAFINDQPELIAAGKVYGAECALASATKSVRRAQVKLDEALEVERELRDELSGTLVEFQRLTGKSYSAPLFEPAS